MSLIEELDSDLKSLERLAEARAAEFGRRAREQAHFFKAAKKAVAEAGHEVAAAEIPPFLSGIGAVSALWRFANRRAIAAARTELARREADIKSSAAAGRKAAAGAKTLAAAAARLRACVAKLPELDHPDPGTSSRIGEISLRVRALGASARPDAVLSSARELVLCVETWAKASALARKKTGASDQDQSRIWLPVPRSMAATAEKLGASKDDGVGGASPFYVSTGTPLAVFDSLLPLGYRRVVPKLSFACDPASGGRDRLSNFIDPMTWDHVSSVNSAMTGRRCILCGKQSGTLANKIAPGDAAARSGVSCHEVWSWTRPDPAVPVGIQSLERILVLCFDCRMCFKEEEALAAASALGEPGVERGVQGYLLKRRAFLTRSGPKEVAAEMKAEQTALSASADVKTWIVDVGKLAKQDYMYGHTPTLMLGNSAKVRPANLAGIAFRDTEGKTHPAVSADRLYQNAGSRWIAPPEPSFKVVGKT